MQKEIWKDIKGYEGLYQISSYGKVMIISSGKMLKPEITEKGYLRYELNKNGKRKRFKAHRLVGMNFIENNNNLPQINHKDGIKTNNHVSNLEWCDNSHNVRHAVRLGLYKRKNKHETDSCRRIAITPLR